MTFDERLFGWGGDSRSPASSFIKRNTSLSSKSKSEKSISQPPAVDGADVLP